jgi:hypothetical protein
MMKNILFMVLILCLVLAACHSSRGLYVYEFRPIDKARQDKIDDFFDRSIIELSSELDSSKDGYYFVYDRSVEFDEPIMCFFFYDKGDSITICPFQNKARCRNYDFKSMDIPVEGVENALPLFPKKEAYGGLDRSIFGYKKEGGTKTYFRSYLMDGCNDYYQMAHQPVDTLCKDKWKQSVEENIEQFIFNGKMFNRYEYLVNRLFITEKIEGWREAGLMPEDEYEDVMRRHQEEISKLERDYEELLNMSVPDSTSQL